MKESVPKIIIASTLFYISVMSMVLSLNLKKFNKRESRGMIGASFCLLAIEVWVIMQSKWIYIISRNIALNYYVEFIAAYCMPVFFYYYLYNMCNIKDDFIIKKICKFHFALLVIYCMVEYLGVLDFYSIHMLNLYIILITLIISSLVLFKNLRKNTFLIGYIGIIFLLIIVIISEIFLVTYLSINVPMDIIVISLFIMSLNLIYNFFTSYFKMYDLKIKSSYLQKQFSNQLNHYKVVTEDFKELRKYRHDMKNHLLCINHLINTEDYSKALSYIEDINVHLSRNSGIFDTANPILDAILTEKKRTAVKKGIDFIDNIVIAGGINIEPVDFCIIFGNALDNAIESCEKVSKGNKEIQIDMVSKNNMLIVKIKNSKEGNLILNNNKILTSKLDKKNHGIGLDNIKEVIKRYEGILDITSEDDYFELSFTLYNV